jgi:tetratricopeptide (TPR) repeat protein
MRRGIACACLLACAIPATGAEPGPLHEAESLLLAQRTRPDAARFERAKGLVLAEVKRSSSDAKAWTLLAWAHMIDHRFGDALDAARTANDLAPDDPRPLALMSDALLELGRYDDAVAVTQRLVDLDPGVPAWTRAAHVRFLHNDLEGAIQLMDMAARAAGTRGAAAAWVWVHLARLHLHAGDAAAAAGAIDAAQQAYPGLAIIVRERARLLLTQGDAQAALESYRQALALQPNAEDALAAWHLAHQLGQSGAEKHFAALLEALAKLDAGGLSRRALAEYFAEAGQTQQALELAQEELAARPDIYSHATLARVLVRAGDRSAAKRHAQAALALSTPDPGLQGDMRAILGETPTGDGKEVGP